MMMAYFKAVFPLSKALQPMLRCSSRRNADAKVHITDNPYISQTTGEAFDPVCISHFRKRLVRVAVIQVAIDHGSSSCDSKTNCS